MKLKCVYCGKEVKLYELATCTINGKKKYCHAECHMKHLNKMPFKKSLLGAMQDRNEKLVREIEKKAKGGEVIRIY